MRCRSTFPTQTKVRAAYPVLPCVSTGYPQHQGRSPTCYSPVRHSRRVTPAAVRLACLKRAASVRSEPGSNSPSYIPWLAPRLYNQSNPVSLAFSFSLSKFFHCHRTTAPGQCRKPPTIKVGFEREKDLTVTSPVLSTTSFCFLAESRFISAASSPVSHPDRSGERHLSKYPPSASILKGQFLALGKL